MMGFWSCLFGLDNPPGQPQQVRVERCESERDRHTRLMEEERKTLRARYEAMLEKLAIVIAERQPTTEAEQAVNLATFTAAHQDDLNTYRFECRRWGDFLAVFIYRKGCVRWIRVPTGHGDRVDSTTIPAENVAESINLAGSHEIKLIEGHVPNMEGLMFFHPVYADENTVVRAKYNDYYGYSRGIPPVGDLDGLSVSVTSPKARQPYMKALIYRAEDRRPADHCYGGELPQKCAAQPDEDDQIVFIGSNVVIPVPATLGRHIYEMIMTEIDAGYKRIDLENRSAERLALLGQGGE